MKKSCCRLWKSTCSAARESDLAQSERASELASHPAEGFILDALGFASVRSRSAHLDLPPLLRFFERQHRCQKRIDETRRAHRDCSIWRWSFPVCGTGTSSRESISSSENAPTRAKPVHVCRCCTSCYYSPTHPLNGIGSSDHITCLLGLFITSAVFGG